MSSRRQLEREIIRTRAHGSQHSRDEVHLGIRGPSVGRTTKKAKKEKPVVAAPDVPEIRKSQEGSNLRSYAAELESAMGAVDVGWCGFDKAMTLAAIVMAFRPKVVVELGVWMGGSAIPMAIALRQVGSGRLIAVDAWSADASVLGQDDEHRKWWGETMSVSGHDHAYDTFIQRLKKHRITTERCLVLRQRTDEAQVPTQIDILHHDANHGPQAVDDIDRWAPSVRVGGLLIFDDLNWPGGHVKRARVRAIELGFVDLYDLGSGCVMQRTES